MIAARYYYNRLPSEEKEIYTCLYKGVTALEKEIYVPRAVTPQQVDRVFLGIASDNPHLYYFNSRAA